MKRAAFASVVVLAVIAAWSANLFSQQGGPAAAESGTTERVAGRYEPATPDEDQLRKGLLRALEENARKTGRPPAQVPMMGLVPSSLMPMMGSSIGTPYGESYRDPAAVQEELRQTLRQLVEENSKYMSADELREAIHVVEQLTVEREFARIIEQLRAVAKRGDAREVSLAARKANLAIQLLTTSDPQILREVEEALSPPYPRRSPSRELEEELP